MVEFLSNFFSRRLLQNIQCIMSWPLFFELSCCIIATVCELLTMDQIFEEQNFDAYILISINCLGIHISMVYVLCHYSEKLTNHSFSVNKVIYTDLLWYNLSNQQQKNLLLPMCCSQKTFQLTGCGIFDCSMEMFLKVRQILFFFQNIFKFAFISDNSTFHFLFHCYERVERLNSLIMF